jgi:hypothetical protein
MRAGAGKSPCTVRSPAPRLPRPRQVPAATPHGRANADARECPQRRADASGFGVRHLGLSVQRNLASRFGADSPVPSARICGHPRASAFPSCFVARRTGPRGAPHPPDDNLRRKVVIPLPGTAPPPACALRPRQDPLHQECERPPPNLPVRAQAEPHAPERGPADRAGRTRRKEKAHAPERAVAAAPRAGRSPCTLRDAARSGARAPYAGHTRPPNA